MPEKASAHAPIDAVIGYAVSAFYPDTAVRLQETPAAPRRSFQDAAAYLGQRRARCGLDQAARERLGFVLVKEVAWIAFMPIAREEPIKFRARMRRRWMG